MLPQLDRRHALKGDAGGHDPRAPGLCALELQSPGVPLPTEHLLAHPGVKPEGVKTHRTASVAEVEPLVPLRFRQHPTGEDQVAVRLLGR